MRAFSLLAEVGNKKNTGEQSTISSPHSQPFYIPHPITGPPWDHYRENIQGGTGWGTANDVLHFYQYFSEFLICSMFVCFKELTFWLERLQNAIQQDQVAQTQYERHNTARRVSWNDTFVYFSDFEFILLRSG